MTGYMVAIQLNVCMNVKHLENCKFPGNRVIVMECLEKSFWHCYCL